MTLKFSNFQVGLLYNSNFSNPIKNADKNGNCPWCAVIAGAWEYGTQVYDNYEKGETGYEAWIGKVDFVDVAVEAGTNLIPGGRLLKGAVMVGGELIKNSVDGSFSDGISHIGDGTEGKDVSTVLKKTGTNLVLDKVGGAVVGKIKAGELIQSATDNKAVKSAVSDKVAAYKNLTKSNNVVKNGNKNSKAVLPNDAFKAVNKADQNLTIKKALNSVGTGTEASKELINKGVGTGVKSIIKPKKDK